MQKKKGISLIVLVITIIVMIILAASVVITLTNTSVIDRANQAVSLTNEAQIQELAALIWADTYMGGLRDSELVREVENKLENNGFDFSSWEVIISNSGITVAAKDPTLNLIGTIPEGGKYVTNDGTVYNSGDIFPLNVTTGDKYQYKEYEYVYNMSYNYNDWATNDYLDGWGVRAIKNQKEYGPILESINKKAIKSLNYTFYQREIINPPRIPSSVVEMYHTFWYCRSLAKLPDLSRCLNLTSLNSTFADCYSLMDVSDFVIPSNVTDIQYLFSWCTKLITAPTIPSHITNMQGTFFNCNALNGNIIIDANPEKYADCFYSVDMSRLTLSGKSTIKQVIAETGRNGSNVTIVQ